MLTQKQRAYRAGQLLDCMDGISDIYLNQALLWRTRGEAQAAARRRKHRTAGIVAAAAGVLVLTVIRVAIIAALLTPHGGSTPPSEAPSLSASLSETVTTQAFTPADPASLDYFDGTVRLCVCDRESGQVYVSRPLTDREQSLLRREMNAASARTPHGQEADYSVWILCGNGYVVSPCLDNTSGCFGAAELFDYADERVPTDLFRQLLQALGT